MFAAEFQNLEYLAKHSTFAIPRPIYYGLLEEVGSILLMCYLDKSDKTDFRNFGRTLAKMHHRSNVSYGFSFDNFIGRLDQYNTETKNYYTHYRDYRIEPLVEMGHAAGLLDTRDRNSFDRFYTRLQELLVEEAPALIHGDLWSGNFMFIQSGNPAIFDPALSYSSREFDIAMMHLFGGFPEECFDAYQEIFPLEAGWEERMEYFQLYYLLVHLCMFGRSYHARTMEILRKFT